MHSEPSDLQAIRDALKDAGIEYESDEAEFVPSMQVDLDIDGARKFMKLVDALEDRMTSRTSTATQTSARKCRLPSTPTRRAALLF